MVWPLRQTLSSTFCPTFFFKNLALQLRVGADRRAVDLRDHVERTQIAFVGRRIGFDRAHDHAFVDAFEQIADRRVVAQRFDPNAEPRPNDFVPGDQLLADFV